MGLVPLPSALRRVNRYLHPDTDSTILGASQKDRADELNWPQVQKVHFGSPESTLFDPHVYFLGQTVDLLGQN